MSMSFLDEVLATNPPLDNSCGVAKWLTTQADLTDADIRGAAAEVSVASVHRAILNRGYSLGFQSVQRHMDGSCGCPGEPAAVGATSSPAEPG